MGDQFSVWDMLHGLMLPSGNDAAIVLAEHFGGLILEQREMDQKAEEDSRNTTMDTDSNIAQSSFQIMAKSRRNIFISRNSQFRDCPEISAFLEEMNRQAMELQLKGTFYDSPHGLINWCNRSTAYDIARLSSVCMKNAKFR